MIKKKLRCLYFHRFENPQRIYVNLWFLGFHALNDYLKVLISIAK